MGMGYGANMAYTLKDYEVKQICPREFNMVEELLERYETNWDDLAQAVFCQGEMNVEDDDCAYDIIATFEELQKEFRLKTGLTLSLGYHDSDNGDRYDDVNGCYFQLEWSDVVELTPNAKKLKEQGFNLIIDYWVTYG